MSSLTRVEAKRTLRGCLIDGLAAAGIAGDGTVDTTSAFFAATGYTSVGLQLDNESETPALPYVRGTVRHTGADEQESTAWEQGEQKNRFARSGVFVLNVYTSPDEPGTDFHDALVQVVKDIFEGKPSTSGGMRFIRVPANEIGVIPGTGAYTSTVNVFFEYYETK